MNATENIYLSSLEKHYKEQIERYTKKLNAVKVLKEDEIVDSQSIQDSLVEEAIDLNQKKFKVGEIYDKSFTQTQKVYFALRNLGSALAKDVGEELTKLDKSFDIKSAEKLATQKLSSLKGDGVIKHIQLGKKYKYVIK